MITKKRTVFNLLLVLTLISLIWLQGCEKKENPTLSRKTFTSVLAELLLIENLSADDAQKIALTKKVFLDAKVKAEEFEATKEKYKRNPKYWIKVYTAAQAIIKEKEKSLIPKIN